MMLAEKQQVGRLDESLGPPHERSLTLWMLIYVASLSFTWFPHPDRPGFFVGLQMSDLVFLGLLGSFVVAGGMRWVRLKGWDYLVLAYIAGSLLSLFRVENPVAVEKQIVTSVYLALVYFTIGTLCVDEHRRSVAGRAIAGAAGILSLAGTVYVLAYLIFGLPPAPHALRDCVPYALPEPVPYLGQTMRLDLFFPTPELLGCYLTIGVAFALAFWMVGPPEFSAKYVALMLVLILVTEVFTFSHSWVGFACAATIACRQRGTGRLGLWIRRVLAAGTVALFIGVLFVSTFYIHDVEIDLRKVPAPDQPVDSHVLQKEEWPQITLSTTYGYLHYHVLKVLAWETFLGHPASGVGLGNFRPVSEAAYQEGRLSENCRRCEPHNTVLGQLAETGLLGGLPLLALWAWLFLDGWRLLRSSQGTESEWIARGCFAGLVGLFVNGLYTDVMNFRFLWVSMAVLRGLALSSQWTSAPRAQEATAQDASYAGAQASTTV